jgi:hypothetical protein
MPDALRVCRDERIGSVANAAIARGARIGSASLCPGWVVRWTTRRLRVRYVLFGVDLISAECFDRGFDQRTRRRMSIWSANQIAQRGIDPRTKWAGAQQIGAATQAGAN